MLFAAGVWSAVRGHRWMARATDFLPGAGFTEDQHVRVGRSNHFYLSQNPPQSRAVPDHLLEVLLEVDIFVLDTGPPRARGDIDALCSAAR
jgi:hypothetical protein